MICQPSRSHRDLNQPHFASAQGLLDLLRVTKVAADIYIAPSTPAAHRSPVGRMFGGQVIAQALLAAEASLPAQTPAEVRPTASFHCRFLRPGSEDHPVNYHVARDMDGGSVSHRRVIADQGAEPILTASVMFHQPRGGGVSHHVVMPRVPSPEAIVEELAARRTAGIPLPPGLDHILKGERAIEMLPVNPDQWAITSPQPGPVLVWFRFAMQLPNEPGLHRAVLGYASDMTILRACDVNHGLSWARGEMLQASLDHAIWFHDPFRADDWLLHVTTSDWTGNSRGLAHGQIFTRDGRLVASTSQEALIQLLPKPMGSANQALVESAANSSADGAA